MSTGKTLNNMMDKIYGNPYVMAIVKTSLILYASQIAPRLNSYSIFDNVFVKILAIGLLLYSAERKDFQMAILIALVYVMSINVASGRGLFEPFADFSSKYTAQNNAKLIEPMTHVYPGCQNITIQHLVDAFDGDREKLIAVVKNAYAELEKNMKESDTKTKILRLARAVGLPHKYELKEEHAPYIATLLVYSGFTVNELCAPPN